MHRKPGRNPVLRQMLGKVGAVAARIGFPHFFTLKATVRSLLHALLLHTLFTSAAVIPAGFRRREQSSGCRSILWYEKGIHVGEWKSAVTPAYLKGRPLSWIAKPCVVV